MTDNSPYALLVPIGVQALVVNETDKRSTLWSLVEKSYTGLDKFEPIEPSPFVRGNDWPRTGITLSWALPDGLTRGEVVGTGEDSKLEFPYIPNRWLVVRTVLTPARSHAAWVIESDCLGPVGSNIYPDFDPDNSAAFTKLGRVKPLADWQADREGEAAHLTAVGPGDITFAAYLAGIDNVLSFHDSLLDIRATDNSQMRLDSMSLSYTVIGWYAQPDDPTPDWLNPDPLADWTTKAEWQAIMERRLWSVGGDQDLSRAIVDAIGEIKADDSQNYPSRTVCHGLVSGVNWTGLNGSPQTGPLARRKRAEARQRQLEEEANRRDGLEPLPPLPPVQKPHIAFGNSAVDALASLMEFFLARGDEQVDISDLIQAMEYDLSAMLNQPGGLVELQQEVHRQWFASKPGSNIWEVVEPQNSGLLADNGTAVNPLPGNHPTRDPLYLSEKDRLLADLNRLEQELNEAQRTLQSWQWQLYALWWKAKRRPFLTPTDDRPLPDVTTLVRLQNTKLDDVTRQQANVDDLAAQIITTEGLLKEHLLTDDNPLIRHRGSGPRFYRPADPVALLYGLERGARHGEDGRFTDDGSLFVRFSGQTISALHPPPEPGQPFDESNILLDGSDLEAAWMDDLAGKPIPDVVRALWIESQLLDMAEAQQSWLADGAGASLTTADLAAQQQMIWHDYRQQGITIAALTRAAGWLGVRPSPIAIEPWQPPWSPLFLCWRVSWYPVDDDPRLALDDWTFNGLDYDWKGRSTISEDKAVMMQGRTMLTRTHTRSLENNLLSLLGQIQERVANATEEERAAWESQNPAAASLFSTRFTTLINRIQEKLQAADLLSYPLSGFHDRLIMRDGSQFLEPDDSTIAAAIGQVPRAAPMPYHNGAGREHSPFFPLRAGHFRLKRLWVVDAFGQVFDPIHERGQTAASFTPVRGSGLATIGRKQRTDTQALQLPPRLVQWSRLNFRFVGAGLDANDDNPVAGWLLPNHLDNALVVFDRNGRSLGLLILAGSAAGSSELRWQAAVASSDTVATPADIENNHLKDFVMGLIGKTDNAKAFIDLLAAIDSTLWTTDPMGDRKDNLSTLVGRPLALVRATLGLELAHEAATDQLWGRESANDTNGLTEEDVRFPLKLGHAALRQDGTLGYFVDDDYSAVQVVQPLLKLKHPDYIQHRDMSLSIGRPQTITLLVDPRGSIHARSGILPTKAIRLPARYVERPLAEMDVTFRVGPILTEPGQMRMPLPADIRGGWNWITETGVDLGETVAPASQQPRLPDTPLTLREGWLKLSDALGDADSATDSGAISEENNGPEMEENT